MAVVIETHQVNADTVGRSGVTFSVAIDADCDALAVAFMLRDGADSQVSSAVFNSSENLALAIARSFEYGAGQWLNAEWWYLNVPTVTTANLVVTYENSLTSDAIVVVQLSGTHASDVIGATGSNTGTVLGSTVTLTTEEANSLILTAITHRRNSASGYAATQGTTELADGETGTAGSADQSYFIGYETKATAGAETSGADYAVNSDYTAVAIEIKVATATDDQGAELQLVGQGVAVY